MALAPEVEALARLISEQEDDSVRQRLLKQVSLRADAITPDEKIAQPPIRTLAEYLEADIETPPILVAPGMLVRSAITVLTGMPGKGKTTFVMNRLISYAAGRPVFPGLKDVFIPAAPVRSLVIENEGSAGMFHKQTGCMLNKGPLTDDERELARKNLLIWGDGGWSGFRLDDKQQLNLIRKGIEEFEPDVVFMEPFIGLWRGDENSSRDMGVILDVIQDLCATYNVAVWISHHDRKSGVGDDGDRMNAPRGSSALSGAAGYMEHHSAVKNNEQRQHECSKYRYAQPSAPVRMLYDPSSWWYSHVPEAKGEAEVLRALRQTVDGEPMYVKDLAAELDEPARRIRKLTDSLVEAGRIRKTPNVKDPNGPGTIGCGFRLVAQEDDNPTEGLSI